MKFCCALFLLVASMNAFAEEAKVEVTSFVYAGSRTRAAELCGKITGVQAPSHFVKIVVDPKSKTPGIYNVLVGPEGVFCTTVVTNHGEAEASLRASNQESASTFVETKGRF